MPQQESQRLQIDLIYLPIYTVISCYVLPDYWIASQPNNGFQALGPNIPPGSLFPIKACNQIGNDTFIPPLQEFLGLCQ